MRNEPLGYQILKEETAISLTDIMRGVVSDPAGTGQRAAFKALNIPVAGKTGSTNDAKDLSFIGYTPYYAAGIWSGYDLENLRTIETSHQAYIQNIWRDVMEGVHKELNLPEKGFPALPAHASDAAYTDTPY